MPRKLIVSPETVARICHAANKAYCQSVGDMSQVIWECTPKELRQSAIEGVNNFVENPDLTPEQSHDKWCEFKVKHGWKYGEKKSEQRKEHPCLKGWHQLPPSQRHKDVLFRAIVLSFLEEVS